VKFLANMGISPRTVRFLRELGHEATRLSDVSFHRASDSEVLAQAARENQIVLTFDLDYPALLALGTRDRVSAVIFRTVNADPTWINSRLAQCLPLVEDVLKEGAIVVIEDDRVRVRRFLDL
jgi:predicted nuclease of predicted toxin-antitoxin system